MTRRTTSLNEYDTDPAVGFGGYSQAPVRSKFRRVLTAMAVSLLVAAIVAGVAGYFYWQSLTDSPAYSMALIVDAARRNDQTAIDGLVDTGAVVDDFMPQITEKAIDMYGRGLPPETIDKVAAVATPLLPALKDRARLELGPLIRRKAGRFENVPFAAMVLGADRYLDITVERDAAVVTSRLSGHTFTATMRKSGDRWTIVAIRDAELAERIARAVGQEIIAVATTKSDRAAGERLGVKDLNQLLKNAEEALK